MGQHLFQDIIIILALAMAVVYVCHRLRLPTVVGFLVTGLVAGPSGLGLISSVDEVETLAEVGVVLLLFTIGLEFSFAQLATIKKPMLLGGAIQVLICIAGGYAAAQALGLAWGPAIFVGFLLALSSTAVVLRLLQERAQMDSPQGRTSLAILIFQDVIVVAMLLATPFLAGGGTMAAGGHAAPTAGWDLLLKGVLVVGVIIVAARWLVPWLLNQVAGTKNRELFIITIFALLMAVAGLTAWAGLSLALGAFLAGLIVAESDYSHQTVGNVLPMRDLFTSLFFVSIGMLMDIGFLLAHPLWVAGAVGAVILGKVLAGGLATLALGLPLRVALAVGLALGQVGEFSFVLARGGMSLNLLSTDAYQLILDVSVLTMALTPVLMWLSGLVARRARSYLPGHGPAANRLAGHGRQDDHADLELEGHAIIVGYGINGRSVARAARLAGIPYVVLEMNPATVRKEKAQGEPVIYGDAVNPSVLEHVGIAHARVMVVAIADPVAARQVVATAKDLHPGLHVICRIRYLGEVEELFRLGADEVVPEEYETAVAIFVRTLRRFLIPEREISRLAAELRAESYSALRHPPPHLSSEACHWSPSLGGTVICTEKVEPGSPAQGRSLGDLDLRAQHGLSVLAVRRQGETMGNPGADTILQEGDELVVMAEPAKLPSAEHLFLTPDGGVPPRA